MKAKHRVVIAVLSVVLLIMTSVIAAFAGKREAKADDNESPFALNVNSENLPEGFFDNQAEACEITGRFFEYLRNTYGATFDDSVYTVCGVRAESFPPYYAGNYINTEGHLVVQIAEAFYSPDYKESDWYQEFVDIVGSENFYCHPVKYSFSELVNAISAVTIGNLAEEFSAIGVTIVDASIDEYTNRVYVHFGSHEDYAATITMLETGIYSASVVDYTLSDYIGVYPGEGISTSSTGTATFSLACRVRRSEPGGSYTYGYLGEEAVPYILKYVLETEDGCGYKGALAVAIANKILRTTIAVSEEELPSGFKCQFYEGSPRFFAARRVAAENK